MTLRAATPEDCDLLLEMIRELAVFENLADQVTATPQILRESLFGSPPAAAAIIAEVDNEPAGYALYFSTFSTFTGKAGLYLEDIYVRPGWRKIGLGKKLLQQVAGIAVERGCPRLEWSVLDWNQPAIDFYRSLGAEPLSEWIGQRLTGAALKETAK
ncbi:MAG: GNAT family N-acetyltransferase [Gammaproteobacteria bacterium]|nr:GNAT family N-acetyltransferase [Pseudomonadales bacterium]